MIDKIKIALVDDELIFLEGLEMVLSQRPEVSIELKSSNGSDFLSALNTLPADCFPDVVLLDIQMNPMDGFELVQRLKDKFPKLSLIVLSSHNRPMIFGHMIRLGASAFLSKLVSCDVLIKAIQSVHKTGLYLSPKDNELLSSFIRSKNPKKYFNSSENLSQREIEVLKLICAENTNLEIAEKLFLSKRTIESHRQRILDKIGAKNTAGMVVYAIAQELYLPPSFNFYN
mgnify:CR=1 FL=1